MLRIRFRLTLPRPAAVRWAAPRTRRARGRVVVVSGAVFAAAAMAAFNPLAARWPQLRDGEYGSRLADLRAQLRAKPADQPCVVVVGGSMTGWGFNPAALESVRPGTPDGPVVFNFSLSNARTVAHLLCVRRLLADGVRPDLLAVETFPWCFQRGFNGYGPELFLPHRRLAPADLTAVARYHPDPGPVVREWVGFQAAPWHAYRQNLQTYFLPDLRPETERLNHSWRYTDRNGWEVRGWHLANARGWPPGFALSGVNYFVGGINANPIDPEYVLAYHDLARLCGAARVPLALVRMPEHGAMRAGLLPAVQATLDATYANLTRATGVRVVDARGWCADADFFDGTHLDPPAATRFTRRLEAELLAPFLARRPPR